MRLETPHSWKIWTRKANHHMMAGKILPHICILAESSFSPGLKMCPKILARTGMCNHNFSLTTSCSDTRFLQSHDRSMCLTCCSHCTADFLYPLHIGAEFFFKSRSNFPLRVVSRIFWKISSKKLKIHHKKIVKSHTDRNIKTTSSRILHQCHPLYHRDCYTVVCVNTSTGALWG